MKKERLVGATISCRVVKVEPYGVYLEFDGDTVVVLIPDVSFEPVLSLVDKYRADDVVAVKILAYVDSAHLYKGSIREAELGAS